MNKFFLAIGFLLTIGLGIAVGFLIHEKITLPKPGPEPVFTSTYTNASDEEIIVQVPAPGSTIVSPIIVSGQARGSWFFEATAPVYVIDWDGLIIGSGYVTAQGDWMTEELVPFVGTITYDQPTYKDNGVLIFHNSNPSGLSANDKAVEVPIFYQMDAE